MGNCGEQLTKSSEKCDKWDAVWIFTTCDLDKKVVQIYSLVYCIGPITKHKGKTIALIKKTKYKT